MNRFKNWIALTFILALCQSCTDSCERKVSSESVYSKMYSYDFLDSFDCKEDYYSFICFEEGFYKLYSCRGGITKITLTTNPFPSLNYKASRSYNIYLHLGDSICEEQASDIIGIFEPYDSVFFVRRKPVCISTMRY